MALTQAAAGESGAVAVITDGQKTAWSTDAPAGTSRIRVYVPTITPPPNGAILSAVAQPQWWTPRGTLELTVQPVRDSTAYRIAIGDNTIARGVVVRSPGDSVTTARIPLVGAGTGWQALDVTLEPSGVGADDHAIVPIVVGSAPAVREAAGEFVGAAVAALRENGRVRASGDVTVSVAPAAGVAALPALIPPTERRGWRRGRQLRPREARHPWRYGAEHRGSQLVRAIGTDLRGDTAIRVSTWFPLVAQPGVVGDTIAMVGATPWMVRGPKWIVLGSALDPASTTFPVRATFVPWLADAVSNLASGTTSATQVTGGARLTPPAGATELRSADAKLKRPVTTAAMTAPATPGLYYWMRGSTILGAVGRASRCRRALAGACHAGRTHRALRRQRSRGKLSTTARRFCGACASRVHRSRWQPRCCCWRCWRCCSKRGFRADIAPAPPPVLIPWFALPDGSTDSARRHRAAAAVHARLELAAGPRSHAHHRRTARLGRCGDDRGARAPAAGTGAGGGHRCAPRCRALAGRPHGVGRSTDDIALYPPREGFGEAEPHAEVAGERVETLEKLSRGAVRLLLTTSRALMEKTQLAQAVSRARLEIRKGEAWRLEDLSEHLDRHGFERVPMVEDVGQYSVRGGIFDIYSFGMAEPVRLEFWGDEIVELRHFDLLTQRSTRDAAVALVLPVDIPAGDEGDASYERVTVTDLLPPDTLLVQPLGTSIEPELQRTWTEAQHHVELARRRGEDAPARDRLFEHPDATRKSLRRFGTLHLIDPTSGTVDVGFPLRAPEAVGRDMNALRKLVSGGTPTIILCDNSGQLERLEELLEERGRRTQATLALGVLGAGFLLPSQEGREGLRVLTDHEIFRRERRIRRTRKYSGGAALDVVTALKNGDYVVHLEHGIGIYRGLSTTFVGESSVEVAVIEYEGGDRLNVPLYRIDQVERYRSATDISADAPPPRLHKLGGRKWSAQRDKTRAAILEMTHELLDLYARRRIASRPAHVPDTNWQKQLESGFLFEDTPDQRRATEDVKKDMEGGRPMDRLLVGDVGYGKTEIAVRAAFKAVQSGRQVAVLVPTTILADQHVRTFGDRLADFPVVVEEMSRFRTAKEQSATLERLKKKEVDIVIGTHRLLGEDIVFADLGLIIVDEEHRFGVKHKERLKQLKMETDVLTLTATPIPRTLHQSLAGLRDMTLMQTPPRDRSPVLTYVEPNDDALLEEAINRELDRGGQCFFVHNRIETILAVADHLQRIVPRAKIVVGHGQMKERELEEVMRRFVNGEADILVSTMIVESGLDVSNANTMFVDRADHFGLAQLYQLRGRVGRSHRRAYCYLLVPDIVDEDAERRLRVLEHNTELGSGYRVALKDMELRGAGNLLGPEQSGFVHAVGFDLYLRLLEETVTRIQRGDKAPPPQPSEVSLDVPAFLPDDYVPMQDLKLDVYRRLTKAPDAGAIEALADEVRDRFGPLPPAASAYFDLAKLRLLGADLGIESMLVRGDEARITFRATAVPRMKGLSAAFHEVQFQAEVRRAQPLTLKLTRLGGVGVLEGLVRSLRSLSR